MKINIQYGRFSEIWSRELGFDSNCEIFQLTYHVSIVKHDSTTSTLHQPLSVTSRRKVWGWTQQTSLDPLYLCCWSFQGSIPWGNYALYPILGIFLCFRWVWGFFVRWDFLYVFIFLEILLLSILINFLLVDVLIFGLYETLQILVIFSSSWVSSIYYM